MSKYEVFHELCALVKKSVQKKCTPCTVIGIGIGCKENTFFFFSSHFVSTC